MAQPRSSRRTRPSGRPPVWAITCAVIGTVLVLLAGGTVAAGQWLLDRYGLEERDLFGEQYAQHGEDLTGPLNILLVGIDTRPGRQEEAPLADTVMMVHVDKALEKGYLVSLPRDLLVEIPPMPEANYPGGYDKLNAAMYHGSQQTGDQELPDLARGFSLLARTVTGLTGITGWDAGAVIDFSGFVGVVDALGGIRVTLTERVVSQHREPDGSHRQLAPDGHGYIGPQAVYEPGEHHLDGWQALDLARQRYGVEGGDYGRQHHQQLIIKAMAERGFSRDVVTDPVQLDRVVRAAGDSLVFDGRGHRAVDFAFALRGLRAGSLRMLELPAHSVGAAGTYQGEELDASGYDLFTAVRQGRMAEFVDAHPDLVAGS